MVVYLSFVLIWCRLLAAYVDVGAVRWVVSALTWRWKKLS